MDIQSKEEPNEKTLPISIVLYTRNGGMNW